MTYLGNLPGRGGGFLSSHRAGIDSATTLHESHEIEALEELTRRYPDQVAV